MSFRPYAQKNLKISPKLGYNSNFSKTQKNFNSLGLSGLIKKNRDITPFRKYKQIPKKKTTNNIIKNNKGPIKNIKIEGDLMTSANYGMKRAKTPINKIGKSIINNSSNNKNNLNSISLNNSVKLNKQVPKTNIKNIKNSRSINNYYSPLNKNSKTNYSRSITPNNKNNLLKNQNYNNGRQIKFVRSTTPIPKSKITLNKKNSINAFSSNNIFKNKKLKSNSPFLGHKNKNFLSSSSISNKAKAKNGLNIHYNNIFKSKNIFAKFGPNKNKPKVITINMNINQNFSSISSKTNNNNNNNDISNKTTPKTVTPLNEQNDESPINNNNENPNNNANENISNDNNNNNSIGVVDNNLNNNKIIIEKSNSSSSFSILNKFNDLSKVESRSSLIINGIQPNTKVEESKNNINEKESEKEIKIQSQNNLPKQVRKKILCMHEFSKTGYAGEDEKKINQDNYFVFRNFMNDVNYIFMAVCDGHGTVGQEISNFLKENLPIDLNHALRNQKKDILKDDISGIITSVFIKENNKLISNEMINSMLSGSTCVSTIYTPIKLITANVGDSRIILGKHYENLNKWLSIDLTRDHKPSLPEEEKRILDKGGRIEPMRDEDNSFIGPPRVWLKEQDYPGLAMSRSFGDRVAHSVGVSEVPEIKEYTFCREDKFFVVASDGLFEFISSQDIVEIIKDFYLSGDIVGCCEYLYKFSKEKWMKEEEVVDDITMILVFLENE